MALLVAGWESHPHSGQDEDSRIRDDRFGASEHVVRIENGFPQTAALASELTNLLQAGLLAAGVGLEPTTRGSR